MDNGQWTIVEAAFAALWLILPHWFRLYFSWFCRWLFSQIAPIAKLKVLQLPQFLILDGGAPLCPGGV
jgi:hypothetical protein